MSSITIQPQDAASAWPGSGSRCWRSARGGVVDDQVEIVRDRAGEGGDRPGARLIDPRRLDPRLFEEHPRVDVRPQNPSVREEIAERAERAAGAEATGPRPCSRRNTRRRCARCSPFRGGSGVDTVTEPEQGSATAAAAAFLASVLAERDPSLVLADLDPVHRRIDAAPVGSGLPGVTDVLAGRTVAESDALRTPVPGGRRGDRLRCGR